MIALGLLETHGYVAAVAATDAMLKAANVYLLERSLVGCGLVTISIAAKDVSSVQAAIDAGVMQVNYMGGTLISKHVIARPDVELEHVIRLTQAESQTNTKANQDACQTDLSCCGVKSIPASPIFENLSTNDLSEDNNLDSLSDNQLLETEKNDVELENTEQDEFDVEDNQLSEIAETEIEEDVEQEDVKELATDPKSNNQSKRYTVNQLRKLNLTRLREIALAQENFFLSKEEIENATKNSLVAALSKIQNV